MSKYEESYSVKPVTKYVAVRHLYIDHGDGRCSGGSENIGTFDSADAADRVISCLKNGVPAIEGTPETDADPRNPNIRPQ